MLRIRAHRNLSGDLLVAAAVLLVLMVDTLIHFAVVPYAGFRTRSNGEVVSVCAPENGDVQPGDRILALDDLQWSEFENNPQQQLFANGQAGDIITVTRQRGGRTEIIQWEYAGFTPCELFHRTRTEWWLGYLFWLAGMLTVLHIRPRDGRRLVLMAFFFINAIWLTWGGGAWHNVWGSYYVFRFAIWLTVPIFWHLHWIFPRRLTRLPRPVLALIYSAGVVPAIADVAGWLPEEGFQLAFLLAFGGALLIMVWRLFRRPRERSSTLLLLSGFLLAIGLSVAATIASLLGVEARFELSSIITITAIPGTYFHAVVREQFPALRSQLRRVFVFYFTLLLAAIFFILFLPEAAGQPLGPIDALSWVGGVQLAALGITFTVGLTPLLAISALATTREQRLQGQTSIRANPLLTPFLFLILITFFTVTLSLLLSIQFSFTGAGNIPLVILITLFSTVAAWQLYPSFRRLIDRYVLGIKLDQRDLLATFATRLSTSPDRQALARLLREEILPSLLIRQSQLLLLPKSRGEGAERSTPLLSFNVPASPALGEAQIAHVSDREQRRGVMKPAELGAPQWIALILPLRVGEQMVGLWLVGRQDPGDRYEESAIHLMRALADQMAIALANIIQTENLQRLYRANIDRHEAERGRLARELHDEVLNQLASITMFLNERAVSEKFDEAYAELTQNLRRTISGLRPAMLAYGLSAALEELRDDIEARRPEQRVVALFSGEEEFARYPPRVEEYLFRIAQQAVENALQHAEATEIEIEGTFTADAITVRVSDNGKGFPAGPHLDLSSLLAQRHFGIAGMYERAELIGAELRVEAAPDRGTVVTVTWRAAETRVL